MNINLSEILIILFYFSFLFIISYYSKIKNNRKIKQKKKPNAKQSQDDFFISNKNFGMIPVFISILATETSAASLLLFPELGFNNNSRFIFLQMVLGYIVGRIIVALFFIPKFYNSGVVSIYEYIKEKYSDSMSKFISALYILATFLAAGIRLFIAAVGLYYLYKTAEGDSYLILSFVIIIAAIIATLYSWQGGLRAVIYTDNLQFGIIFLGSVIVILASLQNNTWPALEFTDFVRLNWTPSFWSDTYFFPTAFLGGVIITLGSHGTDQTIVQRVLSCRDVKTAQNSMLYSAVFILPLITFFLFIGYIISGTPEMMGIDIQASAKGNVFPFYIKNNFPPLVRGLITIVFLAAAMSSLDSGLHSMSTILTKAKFRLTKNISAGKLSLYSGFSLLLSALIFQYIKYTSPTSPLISLALGATGMIFGPMVAIFLFAFQKEKINIKRRYIVSGLLISPLFFAFNKFFRPEGFTTISWVLPILISFIYTYLLIYFFARREK